eukprot:1175908-Prorocentrum_minimum.AAC.2
MKGEKEEEGEELEEWEGEDTLEGEEGGTLENYEILGKVGDGNHGECFLVRPMSDPSKTYVLKVRPAMRAQALHNTLDTTLVNNTEHRRRFPLSPQLFAGAPCDAGESPP